MPNADWERAAAAWVVLSLQELRQMVRKSAVDKSRTAGVNGEAENMPQDFTESDTESEAGEE